MKKTAIIEEGARQAQMTIGLRVSLRHWAMAAPSHQQKSFWIAQKGEWEICTRSCPS